MSQNPDSKEFDNYYSPQAMSSRMFNIDLQIENLKYIVRSQIDHMKQVDAAVLDLQHQIRACMARHDREENNDQATGRLARYSEAGVERATDGGGVSAHDD